MPSTNYGNVVYWQQKYKQTPTQRFDWLFGYQTIKPILQYLIPDKQAQILYAGCGNSPLSDKLSQQGYESITNIDFSKQVITQALKRKQNSNVGQKINYKCVDVLKLDTAFDANQFDVVIDKSLIDSILCSEDFLSKVLMGLMQIEKVLKMGGKYICFSIGAPKNRRFYFKNKLVKFELEFFPISKFEQFKLAEGEAQRKIEIEETTKTSKVDSKGVVKNVYCYVCTKVVETKLKQKQTKKKGKTVHYDKEDEMHEMPDDQDENKDQKEDDKSSKEENQAEEGSQKSDKSEEAAQEDEDQLPEKQKTDDQNQSQMQEDKQPQQAQQQAQDYGESFET